MNRDVQLSPLCLVRIALQTEEIFGNIIISFKAAPNGDRRIILSGHLRSSNRAFISDVRLTALQDPGRSGWIHVKGDGLSVRP